MDNPETLVLEWVPCVLEVAIGSEVRVVPFGAAIIRASGLDPEVLRVVSSREIPPGLYDEAAMANVTTAKKTLELIALKIDDRWYMGNRALLLKGGVHVTEKLSKAA